MIEDLPTKLDELQALKTLDVSLPPQFLSVEQIFSNFKCLVSSPMMFNNVSHNCGVFRCFSNSQVGLHWASRFNCPSDMASISVSLE